MNQQPHSCASAMMNGEQVELSAPLARLKREHGPLREQMDEFARIAAGIGTGESQDNWQEPLFGLRAKVQAFADRLDPHSELEEGTLFPLIAKYIGRETGPISVMEYEHDQAKRNLRVFLEKSVEADAPVTALQAAEIASYASAAHSILTEHFMKEENVLFPMAEKLLSEEDKQLLAEKFEETSQ